MADGWKRAIAATKATAIKPQPVVAVEQQEQWTTTPTRASMRLVYVLTLKCGHRTIRPAQGRGGAPSKAKCPLGCAP